MAQYFSIHPDNPQVRLLKQAEIILRGGGVIVYPTDSCYALACLVGEKGATDRVRQLRQLGSNHLFTLVCRGLSELGVYAKVGNSDYRLLKSLTPGAYTFILKATREVPRRLQHEKRKTVGLRVPDHPIAQALLAQLGEPLLSASFILPGATEPLTEPRDIAGKVKNQVDLVIDGGACGIEPTTVLDLSRGNLELVRTGRGEVATLPV